MPKSQGNDVKDGLLVLNAGSSSLKFALYSSNGSDSAVLLRGQIAGIGNQAKFQAWDHIGDEVALSENATRLAVDNHIDAITLVLNWIHQQVKEIRLVGVGHRVVHGGRHRKRPALVTNELIQELESLCPLAPHHQPHNISAIRAVREMDATLPQVACFDTAFHADQPAVARRLPLPRHYQQKGLMRYGFHGLSYEYISSAVPRFNHGLMPERLLVAHLGNGASLCAIAEGKSIATTMGFSTLDGIMMGTRSGSLDPGVLLHLMHEEKLGEAEISDVVYNQSGLLGVSGISSDMQVLQHSHEPHARAAIDSFCYSIQQAVGSLIATLEGLDGLVFTGGIGEHSVEIRARVCDKLRWLGLKLDESSNSAHGPLISCADSSIHVWVIPTDEEGVIASHSLKLINQSA